MNVWFYVCGVCWCVHEYVYEEGEGCVWGFDAYVGADEEKMSM